MGTDYCSDSVEGGVAQSINPAMPECRSSIVGNSQGHQGDGTRIGAVDTGPHAAQPCVKLQRVGDQGISANKNGDLGGRACRPGTNFAADSRNFLGKPLIKLVVELHAALPTAGAARCLRGTASYEISADTSRVLVRVCYNSADFLDRDTISGPRDR